MTSAELARELRLLVVAHLRAEEPYWAEIRSLIYDLGLLREYGVYPLLELRLRGHKRCAAVRLQF